MTDTTNDESIAWLVNALPDPDEEAACWKLYPHTLIRIPTGITFDVVCVKADRGALLLERLASYDMGAVPVASSDMGISILTVPGSTEPFKREGYLRKLFPGLDEVTLFGKDQVWFAPPITVMQPSTHYWIIPPSASPLLPQATNVLAALVAAVGSK